MPLWLHFLQNEVFPGNRMTSGWHCESFDCHHAAGGIVVKIKLTLWEWWKFPGVFSIYSEMIVLDTQGWLISVCDQLQADKHNCHEDEGHCANIMSRLVGGQTKRRTWPLLAFVQGFQGALLCVQAATTPGASQDHHNSSSPQGISRVRYSSINIYILTFKSCL